jgi:hypothetical protein
MELWGIAAPEDRRTPGQRLGLVMPGYAARRGAERAWQLVTLGVIGFRGAFI